MTKTGNNPKVLGLDISTKTIGWALFDIQSKDLLELTHFSPKVKLKKESKVEEMMLKVNQFSAKLEDYKNVGITRVIYDVIGILPEFISTYDSRKFAFPTLFSENKKGKKVLFGSYDKGCDKKHIIWQKVSDKESHLTWVYTRNNTLKKENYDMSDAYTCVLGQMNKTNIW